MGLRCLLIAANQVRTPYPVYPLALACLTGALNDAGHQVEQFDCLSQADQICQNLAETIARFGPDLIGISLRNLDSEDSTRPESYLDDAIPIINQVRQSSSSPVVLGGSAFSLMPERIMDLLKADWGIAGEGEQLLVDLADSLAGGIRPQWKLQRSSPDHTCWSPLTYSEAISSYYLDWGGILNVQTKRGCPYRCAYCSYPLIEGRRIRARDPEAVVSDVQRLERDFNARYIFFTDSVFNDPAGHYLEVCETLIRSGNRLPWTGYFRPAGMSSEEMSIMKTAGLDAMEVGADCGCDTTLARMKKNFTFSDVIAFNELAAQYAIPCAHFIMFGGPGETMQTVRESLDNLDRLKSSLLMAFNGIRILPGTDIFEEAVKDGVIEPGKDLLAPVYYFSPGIDAKSINTLLKKRWDNRPDRMCPGACMTERVAQFHKKGFTGPIWDKIIRMGWK